MCRRSKRSIGSNGFAKELGILVTINGDNFELVGVFGADEVKDGLLPNGDRYSWYKRRRP